MRIIEQNVKRLTRAANKAKKAAAAAEATEVVGIPGIAENAGEISEVEEFFDAPTGVLEESAVPDAGAPSDALFTPVNLAPASQDTLGVESVSLLRRVFDTALLVFESG